MGTAWICFESKTFVVGIQGTVSKKIRHQQTPGILAWYRSIEVFGYISLLKDNGLFPVVGDYE